MKAVAIVTFLALAIGESMSFSSQGGLRRGCAVSRGGHKPTSVLHAKPPMPREGEDEEDFNELYDRPGMQDPSARLLRRFDKSKSVPADQQPFNELQQLKEAPLFGWAQLDLKARLLDSPGRGLCRCNVREMLLSPPTISIPIGSTTFPNQLPQALLAANVGGLGVVLVLLIRLYAGWSYISGRLDAEVVDYEESGWYDGSEYCKSPDVCARDQMLNMYEVAPVVDRVKTVLGGVVALFVVTVASYRVVVPEDPYISFSTDYLESVKLDDDQAQEAAERVSKLRVRVNLIADLRATRKRRETSPAVD
ncbi:unnamed protein product [Discosporangium mesarthrocarpum]